MNTRLIRSLAFTLPPILTLLVACAGDFDPRRDGPVGQRSFPSDPTPRLEAGPVAGNGAAAPSSLPSPGDTPEVPPVVPPVVPPGQEPPSACQAQAAQSACGALDLSPLTLDGFVSDEFSWGDASCARRTATMVKNDRRDPAGQAGGYLRRFTYDAGGATRTCLGSSNNHPGWGYTVNHFGSTSFSSRRITGSYQTPLAGRHHAIHEYQWTLTLQGQPVLTTVHWLFATGRDHPLWTVTFDASSAPKDSVSADTRAPYGDLQFDGGANADVDGVAWGDRYKFTSLASPLTAASGWDYSQPNTIPYVAMWTNASDAEMGAVQTQSWAQHDAGGYALYSSWGQRSSGPMPQDYNWTYQLNQYELPFTAKSKRLAWGANYGAVGQSSYAAYGNDRQLSGYPYQSYSVHLVLGRHSAAPVAAEVSATEAILGTRLAALTGAVVTEGPAGVGRSDRVAYAPAGYNHVYGTWELIGEDVDVSIEAGAPALRRPMFVIHSFGGDAPIVELDGECLVSGTDFYASYDAATGALWVTLARDLGGAHRLHIWRAR